MEANFENLPADLQRQISLDLEPYELIRLCSTNKIFNKNICNNDDFWRLKIERDFPILYNYFSKSGAKLRYPKKTYVRVFTELSTVIENQMKEKNIL